MTFDHWWHSLNKEGLERREGWENFKVLAHMAYEAGRKHERASFGLQIDATRSVAGEPTREIGE